jgi:hypothetical protein
MPIGLQLSDFNFFFFVMDQDAGYIDSWEDQNYAALTT